MKSTYVIKANHEFRRLYHRGKSAANRYLVLYCMKNRRPYNRLGLTVSAKFGGAVQRNRAKRLFREAYRLHESELKQGFDLVLVARVIDLLHSRARRTHTYAGCQLCRH